MVETGFVLGRNKWSVTAFLDVGGISDLNVVYNALMRAGSPDFKAREACMVISQKDKGYTYTNYDRHITIMIVGKASSREQMFDSIEHETKHVTEHISEYYGVNPKSEESAYLQGEIGRLLFPAVSYVLCQC